MPAFAGMTGNCLAACINSGSPACLDGVAAYHLFPDFVGGKNEAMRKGGLENDRKMIELAMKTKGSSPFIAGDLSLADLYLAPIALYVALTPDKDALFNVPGFADWWSKGPSPANLQGHPTQSRLRSRALCRTDMRLNATRRFATSPSRA
jgi:glutathione S-transferase